MTTAPDGFADALRGDPVVAANRPGGYVAHHDTRYLGDLSGGLHLGRIPAGQLAGGTTFYRFDGVPSPKRCKDPYRATSVDTEMSVPHRGRRRAPAPGLVRDDAGS